MVEPLKDRANVLFPGIALAGLVAIAAQFLNEHYGAPAMLMAILLGMPLNFLSEEKRTAEGIAFSARALLRLGVALLGARISVEMVQALGLPFLALVVLGVLATIGFSLLIGGLFGRDRLFSFLTGGAVAICGASAAMAIGSILPKRENGERDLAFTVITVTVLSTLAMIFYPILTSSLGLTTDATGVFLGGTIHDVAQVVGAGFSISEETGDLSTLVKLIRVTMLAPIVLVAALVLRKGAAPDATRPPLVPGFVIAFLVLATCNSFGLIPDAAKETAGHVSRWALLAAIAAVGMKTSIPKLLEVGGPAIWMMLTQTVFLALFVLGGIWLIG
ncbi:YeiH family protein [Roseibium marinum]|uniref:Putative integral membrane protein (TIGR00698 family) n=1 Tax=Roseibium marinum TaxID=281252 RepID=A0A2S3UK02_9HYPH|nr:YeiH family protein [Roseibium marinum]POF28036.1 putative integral membrane protein (TIGR00698 family) [Roseibium marinum]